VFPTLGENFGHVIAESLSASCPVICSDQTPWNDVLAAGGGTVLRDGVAAELGAELDRIAVMTPAERLRARELAGAAYRDWRAGVTNPNVLDQVREGRP
jgi:glycosyltransferase involved in cell wall biosynthesis